jgi:glycosyltransferase involved in cell wall biosynthesis
MSDSPRVSIVLPTFRRPDFLLRAVRSVQAQTFGDWELLIVDDNDPSSRARLETEALVAQHLEDPRVRYLAHAENLGGSAARNTGIRAAAGELVAFLDDDDEWHPSKLERQVEVIDASPPDVAAVYCRVRTVEAGTGREALTPTGGGSPSVRQLLMQNSIGSTSCIVLRRQALCDVGLFDESLASRQDIDLYVRIAQRFTFAFVDAPLVTFHWHDKPSISTNLNGAINAHETFLDKYRSLIEPDPEVHHARLHELGKLLLRAERHREARRVLTRAWRLRPLAPGVAVRLAITFSLPRVVLGPAVRLRRFMTDKCRPGSR